MKHPDSSQKYPDSSQYDRSIQNPHLCFQDNQLKSSTVATTNLGVPIVWSGNFAYTFKLTDTSKNEWAVRCFRAFVPERQIRYKAISQYLSSHPSRFWRSIDYLEDEILVDGKRYPITKMPWVAEETLGKFLERNYHSPSETIRLAHEFRQLVGELLSNKIAHGDLAHDNIVVNNDQLVLVDYDGMWVTGLARLTSLESGHSNFQHPKRTAADFGSELDRFSSISIYLALRALIEEPKLWEKYGTTGHGLSKVDGLMFKKEDFSAPQKSSLLNDLKKIGVLNNAVVEFEGICNGPLSAVPTLGEFISMAKLPEPTLPITVPPVIPVPPRVPVSTPSTGGGFTQSPVGQTRLSQAIRIPVQATPQTTNRSAQGNGLSKLFAAITVVSLLFLGWRSLDIQIGFKNPFAEANTVPPQTPTLPPGVVAETNGGGPILPTPTDRGPLFTPTSAINPAENPSATPTPLPTLTHTLTPKPTATHLPTLTRTPTRKSTATATRTQTKKPTNTPRPTATRTVTRKPTNTPRPTVTRTVTRKPTNTPGATNTPVFGELQATVKRRVSASRVNNPYPDQASRFVDSVVSHLPEFQLPGLGVTEQSVRQALNQNDIGDRTNGLVREVWGEWSRLTSDVWNANPQNFNMSPFRRLVVRLIQGRQGRLIDSEQHAIHNFLTRGEDNGVWYNQVDGVIAAVNRESFQWSP